MRLLHSHMKTLVVGVSPGADRYANMAVRRLKAAGHEVVALGLRAGEADGVPILTGTPQLHGVHTISLYINPARQEPLIDYFLSLTPSRIIFNPGTENADFATRVEAAGIEATHGCTLVMLGTDQF